MWRNCQVAVCQERSRRLFACVTAVAFLACGAATGSPARAATAPRKASVTDVSTSAYLTVMIGRALASKAIGCQTPPGMLTLDQVVQQLASLGVSVTVPVIPGRTLPNTVSCVSNNLYPSWAELQSLATIYGLNAVSASQSYAHMTSLTTTAQQFKQSCGSLSAFVANGFHRAWGLFAYPDNLYSTAIQTNVVQDCFAFGRTYANPHTAKGAQLTNTGGVLGSPWLQVTDNIGGGRCNIPGQPCYTEGVSAIGRYLSPFTLQSLTAVAPGTWTSLQAYTFVNGSSASGPIQWNCDNPTGNEAVDWKSHWTNLYEVYCWNDFQFALTGISPSVTIADPATVAQAWGRIPTPAVTLASVVPAVLTPTSKSAKLTWSAPENGTYTVLVGGSDCTSGTQVASGTYAKAPVAVAVTIPATSFPPGADTLRVCLTNDPGHVGSAQTTVTVAARPSVTSVSPSATSLITQPAVTIAGTNFLSGAGVTVDGAAAGSVVVVSPVLITAVLPPAPGGVAGTYDVVVTDGGGASPLTPADAFTYEAAPSVTGVSPESGPLSAGTVITITGAFAPDATVAIGGSYATTMIVTDSTITAILPAAPGNVAGTHDVVVSDAGGASQPTPADTFTYEAVPSVTAVEPDAGPFAGGSVVTITGANFYADAMVSIDGSAATNVVVDASGTVLTITTPPELSGLPGPYDVIVTEGGGVSPATPDDLFTYVG